MNIHVTHTCNKTSYYIYLHIFRYYTSIPLTDTLLSHNTMFTRTVMKNRKDLPPTIRDKGFSVSAGETLAFRDGRLLALAWRAETRKKPLIMMSTCSSANPVSITRRSETVSKPAVVNCYNHSMNGGDVADQLTVFYSFVCKTKKWWRKLFFYFLEVSVVNSYLIYKQTISHPRNHLGYRREIVEQIAKLYIQQAPPRMGPGAPRRSLTNSPSQRLDRRPHFIRKSSTHRDCLVCSKRERVSGRRHRTIYFCNTCTNHPYLCPDTCFEHYHTLTNYKI